MGVQGIFGGAAGLQNEPDHRVLSASTDGTVRVWDPKDMSCSRVLDHDLSEISAMAFHESKDVMITGRCAAWGVRLGVLCQGFLQS